MPRLSVPLTDEQHMAIKVKAAQVHLSQAEVARRLLFAWLKDELLTKDELRECIFRIDWILGEVSMNDGDKKNVADLLDKLVSMREQAIE